MRATRRYASLCAGLAIAAGLACARPHRAAAQPGAQLNPVYVDDSPTAADTFVRVRELVSGNNLDEAVRVLQRLLDEQADRVIASATDPDVFLSVRTRVNGLLRSSAPILAGYTRLVGPRAEGALAEGHIAEVEQAMLLTPAGFEAVLRRGQSLLEDARFEAARLMLEQVVDHPQPPPGGAERLSRLYTLLAGYIDRPEVRQRAKALGVKAGSAVPVAPAAWPAAALERGASALDGFSSPKVPELVSKPLWTAPLGTQASPRDPSMPAPGVRGNPSQVPVLARDLSILPEAQGDWVFINDGATISAWDRFTLTPRWSVTPAGPPDPPPSQDEERILRNARMRGMVTGAGRGDDGPATVSVQGRTLIASVGRAAGAANTRDGDDRIVAIDAATGRLKWSQPLRTLDPSVADGFVRGPILIVEGIAVVAVRKSVPERRLVTLALVGLDIRTGALRWVRPIASTGQMPWLSPPSGAEALAESGGVVYRTDRLGVICAVEASSGRVVWVRRSNVETGGQQGEPALPWQLSAPVLDGASIITLSPDGKRVERLDRATGAILASREARQLGDPAHYLVRAGDQLACVDDNRIRFTPLASFDTAEVVSTPLIAEPGIRGRVSIVGPGSDGAGVRVLAPTTTGALLFDPAHPAAEPRTIALEETGNVLALDNQLVVVDDARVHSYLLWDVAEGLLTERMRADPKNPAPAVTFAELAYRAGRPARIAPAVDAALAAIKDSPASEGSSLARRRLFEAVHGMLNHALERDTPGARRPSGVKPIEDDTLLATLSARLADMAASSDERVAVALTTGRLAERSNNGPKAAAAYQSVLNDPALAGATWHGPAAMVRGELEAARRIEALIAARGAGVYAAQEVQAGADLAALGPAPTIEPLEQLAFRYPLASQTPGVWLKIADLEVAAGHASRAAGALDTGLRTAQRAAAPDPKVVGELAGRLITELRGRRQVVGAASVLRTVRAKFPQATLTSGGAPLDAAKLGAELADRLAATMRWPRVGPVTSDPGQAIIGWRIMQPILRDAGPGVSPLLALERDDEIGVWSWPVGPGKGEDDALLVRSWSMKLEGREVRLVKTTSDAAFFLLSDGQGETTVTKVVAGEAKERWTSDSTAKLLVADDARGLQKAPGVVADQFNTPGGNQATAHDLVVVMDDRTVVLVQRSGRAAGIDAETGETLWTAKTLVSRVYDADLVAGVLAVAGDQEIAGPGVPAGGAIELRPAVQAVEARTGRAVQRIGDLAGHARWIKLTDSGSALLGLDQSVVCLDLAAGQVNWTMEAPENQPIDAAWVFGDQAVMLSPARNLYFATISSGRVRAQPLDIPRGHIDRTHEMEVFPLSSAPKSAFGVSTDQGLALFTAEGDLAGVDGLGADESMIPPKPAEGRVVSAQTYSEGRGGDGLLSFQMHAFDAGSAALLESRSVLLGARPKDMMLLDGRIAMTVGNVTVVLSAPAPRK